MTPLQWTALVEFADKLGVTISQFFGLNWDAFGSLKNPEARYFLGIIPRDRSVMNGRTFDLWKAISYFLIVNLDIFGVFSFIFKWNNCRQHWLARLQQLSPFRLLPSL